MLRFGTACFAFLLAPLAAAGGKELKPKLGDIGGASYAEVSQSREICRKGVEGRIALCLLNTNFESDGDNRKYVRCLPVFEWQAESCAAHFQRQVGKCDGEGPAYIDGFAGFGCTVAAEAADERGEPAVTPVDRVMQARTRAAIRGGPGTGHARTGALEAGREVRVTGEAGAWLRIEAPDGGAAFVHASRLVPPAPRDPAADLAPNCVGMSPGAACWRELAAPPGCRFWYDYYDQRISWAWSGECRTGVAVGPGVLAATWAGGSAELIGALDSGRMQGLWIVRYADGRIDQGPYLDGRKHGRWVDRYASGRVDEGSYVNGMKQGRWVDRYASGNSLEYEYRDGSVHGQPGVYVTAGGERTRGRWSGDCFLDGQGRLLIWKGDRETCPPG